MSHPTWRESLQTWATPQSRFSRIAVLGIGNPLRSDDAAGVLVARQLAQSRLQRDPGSFVAIEASLAPENTTAQLRSFGPQAVLLIDAAEMGETPGTVRWIELDEIDGMSASTHTLPLSILAKYLTLELGCEVKILGIQPRSVEIGEVVSEDVLRAVDEISEGLVSIRSEIEALEP